MAEVEEQKNKFKYKKQVGWSLICLSLVLLVFSTFEFVYPIKQFLLGAFGIMLYPLLVFTTIFSLGLVSKRKFVYSFRYVLYLFLCFFFLMCVIHSVVTGFTGKELSYGEYLSSCYNTMYTPGGVVIGVFTYPVAALLHDIASIVIYSIAFIISLYFVISYLDSIKAKKQPIPVTVERYQNFNTITNDLESLDQTEEGSDDDAYQEETEEEVETPEVLEENSEEDIFIPDENQEESPEVKKAKETLFGGITLTQKNIALEEDNSPARELTEEEKRELFAYIEENYADVSIKMYDSVSSPEFEVLPVEDWDLPETEEEVIAVIMMEQVVFWSNESYSLGPQWGSGLWKTRFYIGERDGKLEVVDFSIPMDINDVPRPSEMNADEETLALLEKLGITHSQYRDLSHQMEGLLAAKIDHDFDSYLDFTQEEYNRYISVRNDYFPYFNDQAEIWDLEVIHIYDWSNRNYNYEDDGTPEFVDQDAEYYNCTEKIDTGKDNLTAEVVDIYLIGEHVIGQQVRITDESTGNVTEMEYQFKYIPQQEEWPDSSRVFIIGGRILSELMIN